MKRAGVLSRETVDGIRRLMRKRQWYSRDEDVWHLVDTVDAQRLVIERLLSGWQAPALGDDGCGWWVDTPIFEPGDPSYREPEEMSRAEQIAAYDRIVRPEAPGWPDDR